jgi:hypothetical protein
MYRIPSELDLSPVVGEFTTQFRIGRFDFQFTLGKVNFAITSPITLVHDSQVVGSWAEGRWPDARFLDLINVSVRKVERRSPRLLVLNFENGIEMHLADSSDQYESMIITIDGQSGPWII